MCLCCLEGSDEIKKETETLKNKRRGDVSWKAKSFQTQSFYILIKDYDDKHFFFEKTCTDAQ